MWFRTLTFLLLSSACFNDALPTPCRCPDKDKLQSLDDGDQAQKLVARRISDSNSQPKVLSDLHGLAGCPGEICGTLSGDAVQPLLAGAGECAQQDMADRIITTAKSQIKDANVKDQMIKLAIAYRKTERNSFPDFSHQPPVDRNSLYCQKAPQNAELNGIVQSQSPNADPNLFFDPKSTSGGGNVKKGADPRTIPFGQSSVTGAANGTNETSAVNATANSTTADGATGVAGSTPVPLNTSAPTGADGAMAMLNGLNTSPIPNTSTTNSSESTSGSPATNVNSADDNEDGTP